LKSLILRATIDHLSATNHVSIFTDRGRERRGTVRAAGLTWPPFAHT
jgi:hypothetical protein